MWLSSDVLQVHLMFDKAIHRATNMPNFATGKLYFFFHFLRAVVGVVFWTRMLECHWHLMNRTQFREQTVYWESRWCILGHLCVSRLYPICSHVLCVYVCNDKPTLCSLKHPSIETTGTQWRGETNGGRWFCVILLFPSRSLVCMCVRARVSACA